MRTAALFSSLLAIAVLAAGCNVPPAVAAPPDLATAGCARAACVPEPNEDCASCFAKIGQCCYGDRDWGGPTGSYEALVARCAEAPDCVACCNECAAMTCEGMRAHHVCPVVIPH